MAAPIHSQENAMKFPHLAAAAACAVASAIAVQAAPLDGRSFEGVFIERGKTSGDADTITFKSGRFRSSACDQYGYGDAPYTATSDGETLRFEAQTTSPKYGKLLWSGSVRGAKLDATVMMERKSGAPVENWVVAGERR
jgi:hypothetical protein